MRNGAYPGPVSNDDPGDPPPTEGWQSPAPPPPADPGPYGQSPPHGQAAPPYGQAPPYGTPSPAHGAPYGYTGYAPPQTEGMAIGALIAAIAAWVTCFPVAIVALVLASSAKKKIAASGGRMTGEGLVTASKWIAWINLGLWAAVIVFFIFAAVFAALSGSTGDADFQRLVVAVG